MDWLNLTRRAFDPYPFSLLTLVVSLEAIILSGFLLMAQNRMTRQADRRGHLDLQINLLAEQELTAILKLLCQVADRAGKDKTGKLAYLIGGARALLGSEPSSARITTVETSSAAHAWAASARQAQYSSARWLRGSGRDPPAR